METTPNYFVGVQGETWREHTTCTEDPKKLSSEVEYRIRGTQLLGCDEAYPGYDSRNNYIIMAPLCVHNRYRLVVKQAFEISTSGSSEPSVVRFSKIIVK